jgi:hypothetical protein
MKQIFFTLSIVAIFSCKNESYNRFNDPKLYENSKDITVYGDIHVSPLSSFNSSFDSAVYVIALETQEWLSSNIKEPVVVCEGLFFTGNMVDSSGVKANNSLLYDQSASSFFYKQKIKKIYGGEDSALYENGKNYLLQNLYNENTSYEEFTKVLNETLDARSKFIAESALFISKKTGEKTAIIIGEKHLDWFKKHGFKIETINSFKKIQDLMAN